MLEDRDYMRQPEYESRWPLRFGVRWSLTVGFLCVYAAVFFAQSILEKTSPQNARWFFEHFALSNQGLAHGWVWQLVTYQFMHAGFLHLLFNGWAIYALGLVLEFDLGKKRFCALMLTSGIIGGVVQSAVAFLWPHYFAAGVVGASACAFGLVAAFAALYPTRELQMLVFFIIPVTVTARTLLLVSAVIALIGFSLRLDNVAHAAHLGGMAMGWLFIRANWQRFFPQKNTKFTPRHPKLEAVAEPPRQSLELEVDAILDKISAHGIKSLTKREREVLESARKKL
jgi:membrane associated rhomboid family serine protease